IKSPEDCSILMYRDNVADLYLHADEIDEEYIKNTDSILVSGTALSQTPSREAIFRAVNIAKENGVEIIFELDYRPYTWQTDPEKNIYMIKSKEKAEINLERREECNVFEGDQ